MINESLIEIDARMKKSVDAFSRDLSAIRTGRASPTLVEHVKVDYAGVPTPLIQLASITAPEARLIVIQPWDRGVIKEVEKAILKADLGLNPSTDGHVIRLPIPPLSEERRLELIKVVHKRAEEERVILRNLRRDAMEKLKQQEKDKEISRDEHTRTSEQLQKLTDAMIEKANELGRSKEAEIMKS
jgi:ribosome recycling factor